jgi:hypothetical protein
VRALRFVAVGALLAAGILARISTPAVPTTPTAIATNPVSVVCPSPARCLAVGFRGSTYGVRAPLGMALADGVWTARDPEALAPVVDSVLSSVACLPVGPCVAVGREEVPAPYLGARSAGARPLIETWDGSAWIHRTGPAPSGTMDARLNGISCSGSTCLAVGQYGRRSGRDRLLGSLWDGTTWSLSLPPRLRYADDAAFEDIACVAPNSCTAVGQFSYELQQLFTGVAPLIERWDGRGWRVELAAAGKDSLDTELNAVACPSSEHCVAVGFQRDRGGTYSTFAEVEIGARWSVVSTPDPAGSPDIEFAELACPRPGRCIAVGSWVSGAHVHALVESWDGKRWTMVPTPAPPDATSTALSAIDCSRPQACIAVGTYERGSPTEHAFSLSWNGRAWTILPMPEPADPAERSTG